MTDAPDPIEKASFGYRDVPAAEKAGLLAGRGRLAISRGRNLTDLRPLEGLPLVGDSLRDKQAAQAVHAQPILVLTGKGEATRSKGGLPANTLVYPDLSAVAQALCA